MWQGRWFHHLRKRKIWGEDGGGYPKVGEVTPGPGPLTPIWLLRLLGPHGGAAPTVEATGPVERMEVGQALPLSPSNHEVQPPGWASSSWPRGFGQASGLLEEMYRTNIV